MKLNTSQVFKEYLLVLNLLLRQRLVGAIYLISACFISTAILAEPYDPQLDSKIDTYLGGRGSPITGNGAVFFYNGVQDDVDPRLIVAIAGAESSFGTHWVNCPESGFNAWSWFYRPRRPCSQSPFGSFADGINIVTPGMARYFNRNWNTIPIIRDHYCPLSQAGVRFVGSKCYKLLYRAGWGSL
jgi:hypothetical protein